MSTYKSNIRKQGDSFYALVVRVDEDGQENVINHYKGRFFKTLSSAENSTQKYIAKHC